VNGKIYGIGELEFVSLQTLRERAKAAVGLPGRLNVRIVTGDVRKMHAAPEHAVASQFNVEMVRPEVTPEDGVTRYQHDHTQGPACAIAAGAATIYRNYFVPVGGYRGQTRDRQLDGLADVGNALSVALGRPVADLWTMRNGYALCSRTGLEAISHHWRILAPTRSTISEGGFQSGYSAGWKSPMLGPDRVISFPRPSAPFEKDHGIVVSECH
jgi:hypothetical protein